MAGTEEIVPPQEGEEVVVIYFFRKVCISTYSISSFTMISVIQFT